MCNFSLRKKYKALVFCLLITGSLFFVQPDLGAQTSAAPPKLVVEIVIEGLPADWITRYWDLLGEGGFKKLYTKSFRYTQAEVPHMLAGGAPSLATLSTGTIPATHGIVSERWYNQLRREEAHPTENYLLTPTGTDGLIGKHGPDKLLAATLGDILSLSSGGNSKVVSISLRPEHSILLGGHTISGAYWYDQHSGNWITSSRYKTTLPPWLDQFNHRRNSELYIGQDWNLILSEQLYNRYCTPDENPWETGYTGSQNRFPYKMSKIRRESMDRDFGVLTKSPFGNTMTFNLAFSAITGENLGLDKYTDLLLINFSSLYDVATLFGPDSREVLDTFLRLDMDLQQFLFSIEEMIPLNDLMIVLTSSHGMVRDPDFARSSGLPNGYFRYRNAMALLNSYLSAIFGDAAWIENYMNQQVYLNRQLIEQKKQNYTELLESAARFLTQFEGIAFAAPVDRLSNGATPEPWSQLIHNSYHPDRSGDIVLILQPGWIEDKGQDTDCLSPYPYDRRIPLMLYGYGIKPSASNRKVSLADIAPTLSYILQIPEPDAACGSLLYEAVK